jgi:hypothetical protein
MYVIMYIGIWWYGQLYVCHVHWYLVVWRVVCMLICTLVSGGMDGCMYVNMYIGIWWYGRLYVNMNIGIWWFEQLYVC